MLYLTPEGGLCNRLRAIASSVDLTSEYKDNLVVLWQVNAELGCKYEDMFKLVDGFTIENHRLRLKANGLKKRLKGNAFSQDNRDDFVEVYKNKHNVNCYEEFYLSTFSNYYNSTNYAWLKLNESMQKKVDEVTKKFTCRCVGFHIRRTDNVDSIQNSPLELFVDAMEKEIANDSSVKFYLATDDEEIKDKLNEQFKDRIIINNRNKVSRKTVSGMQDAVVDLFALANCDKIYGSHWSSFSEVAAAVGSKPLEVIRKS